MVSIKSLVSLMALLSLFSLSAQSVYGEGLRFTDVFARATPPGGMMGAVYGVISNDSDQDIRIESISTGVAGLAEIHESVEVDGMMRMRDLGAIVIASSESIRLRPGGKHIMLMRLSKSLNRGDTFELTIGGDHGPCQSVEVLVGGFGQMDMPQ